MESDDDLTGTISRGPRSLRIWFQTKFGNLANLSESTIRDFEKGRRLPTANNLAAICAALEAAGVEFTNGISRRCGGSKNQPTRGCPSPGQQAAAGTDCVRLPARK